MGRNREFQAVLPLRGKILNVERVRTDKMLSSEQIGTLITALGTGISDDFSVDKLRYHKIIVMTDADVDGAHIRTLLLTFFYRQMRELIDRGHLYIAQPPLYKVTRGKSEQYLKDERALEDYLIATGLDDCVFKPASGGDRTGRDLLSLVEDARIIRGILHNLHSRYNRKVVEQAAIAGVLNPKITGDITTANAAADYIARRLDALADEVERGWTGRFTEGEGFFFERTVRGVKDVAIIDDALLGSADARKLDDYAAKLQEAYPKPGLLRRKDAETAIHGPVGLFEAVTDAGRKGVALQRYKGLGEMNPAQLWETTLDTNERSLLQVKIKEVDEADDIFTKLMGDVVEPRREFIQDNSLSANVRRRERRSEVDAAARTCRPSKYIVEGGHRLAGTIEPSGNKNAALPIIAAALLTEHPVTLENVPRIRDTETLVELIRSVGASAEWRGRNTLAIHAKEHPRRRSRSRNCARGSAPRSCWPGRCSPAAARSRCRRPAATSSAGGGSTRIFWPSSSSAPPSPRPTGWNSAPRSSRAPTSSSMSPASPPPKTRWWPPWRPTARPICATPPPSRMCRISRISWSRSAPASRASAPTPWSCTDRRRSAAPAIRSGPTTSRSAR